MAFCTRYDYFESQVIPLGFSNALLGFFDYINKILAKKFNIFIMVYLDNILINIKDPGKLHINAMYWILE